MRRPLFLRPTAVAIGAAAFGALAAFGASGTAVGAASAPTQSAQSEYQAALKAATNQTVHFAVNETVGKATLLQSGDAGANSGSESVTVHNGKSTERISTRVVGKTGYVNGNTTALQNILGLTAAQAHKYAGQWLSFPMSSTYSQLASGLLRSQVATELSFNGPFTFASDATVNGQHVHGIKGSAPTNDGSSIPEILYVPSTGKPLPTEEVTNPSAKGQASSGHGTVSFSNWGEDVAVQAPAHSVALSKLAPKSTSGATTTTGG